MAKCQKCGFLAVWDVRVINGSFEEAPEFYRYNGRPQALIKPRWTECEPRCFIQKAALPFEITLLMDKGGEWAPSVLNVLEKERTCGGFTKWMPGYSPKEHKQMLDTQNMIREQNFRHSISLAIALIAALAATLGVGVGAYYNMKAAQIQADAQMKSAKMQIDAEKERPVAPINVTIQMPDNKKGKAGKP